MKSEEILPKKYRLTEFQKTQLEGHLISNSNYHAPDTFASNIFNRNELLLKYHQALEEAEKLIENLRDDISDKIVDIQTNLDTELRGLIDEIK